MRTLLLVVLLLPLSLLAQVKILLPVVAKNSAGNAVIDLKQENFSVKGPKNFRLLDASLVPPGTVSATDPRPSIVFIYDAANIPTSSFELNVRDLRDFLADVAHRKLPVTVLINTSNGLRLIYSARTSPEALSAALTATEPGKKSGVPPATGSDPQAEAVAKNLQLLETTVRVPRSRLDAGVDQMKSLLSLAHLVQQMPGRKAVVWVTLSSPVSATQDPAYWSGTSTMASPYPGAPRDMNSSSHADKSLLPMYEAMIEELCSAHVSVYPLLFT